MKYSTLILFLMSLLQAGCGSGFSAADGNDFSASVPNGSVTIVQPSLSDPNVMNLQVGCGYANEPCVTVTICKPGTSTCVSVPNVLVDTGSYGLRLFASTVSSLGLSPVAASGGGSLAECVSYLDSSSDWGPIATADVKLGSQTASNVRMQLIESNFPGLPSNCANPDDSPTNVGFNGIIGVGLFVADCGPSCANSNQNQTYYACSGSSCTNIAVPEAQQVSNPVANLPTDNNGVALQLPNVSASGSSLVSGYLIFGIGTRPNNTPIGATVLTTDNDGNMTTNFAGGSYNGSFIDSGSNGLYFPQVSSVSTCDSSSAVAAGWFCPSGVISLSAVQVGQNGVAAGVNFLVGNADSLFNTSAVVFNDVGAPYSGGFDWGLPFFLGRTVYVGLEGTISPMASGTYWAY